jgi:hypothetical protein
LYLTQPIVLNSCRTHLSNLNAFEAIELQFPARAFTKTILAARRAVTYKRKKR